MKRLGCAVAGIVLLVPYVLAAQQPTRSDAENGKRLFVQDGCYECHGYVGQGGGAGPRIAPWTAGAEGLMRYVRHPAGQMPPYTEKVLPDRELREIWAYLESIPPPTPAQGIPLLNPAPAKSTGQPSEVPAK